MSIYKTKLHPQNDLSKDAYPKTSIDQVEGLQAELDGKQETLISGENIKTINGENILGSGNINIGGGGGGSLYIHRITFSVKGSTQQVCTIEMLSASNTTIDTVRLFNYINSRPNKEIYVLGEFEATGENLTDVWLTSYCRLYLDSLKIGVQPSAYLSINDNMIYNCQDEYESAFIDNAEPYTDDIRPLILY